MDELVSPTIHEAMIDRHFANDGSENVPDDGLDAIRDAVIACRLACERSLDAKKKIGENAMQTKLANDRQIRDVSIRHFKGAAKKVDAARARAEAILKKIEADTTAPSPPKDVASAILASEIRAALARMSDDERGAAVSKAIERGDDLLVGAVLNGAAILTNISDDEKEMRRHAWRSKHFAAELDRVSRLRKALSDLDRIGMLSRKFIFQLTDAEAIERAAETEKAAREAAAA